MGALPKKKFLKFYSITFLAKYLETTKEFLLFLEKKHSDLYYFRPGVLIKNKRRDFYVAKKPLKSFLRKVDNKILNRIDLPDNFQGAIKGKSLKTNAEKHLHTSDILKVDIKNFFPSIKPDRVLKAFLELKMSKDCAKLLSHMVTVGEPKPHLPQGFSTSPKVAALVLKNFEHRLHKLAKQYGWNYTFWVDDITISGNFPVAKFKNLILKILKEEGFDYNPKKIECLTNDGRLEINGVVVNDFPNISKEKRIAISAELNHILKRGITNYFADKGLSPSDDAVNKLRNSLLGTIHFVFGINPNLGLKYKTEFLKIDWKISN